jgi:enterochelin esterase-like enzyme
MMDKRRQTPQLGSFASPHPMRSPKTSAHSLRSTLTRSCVALCALGLLASAGRAQNAPAASLPDLATLKTALTLTEQQAAQIPPILDAQAKAAADLATVQAQVGTVRNDANTKISALLDDTQRPQFAALSAGGARGGGGGGRGGGGGMSAEDQAKLAELPEWKPGVDEGDYSIPAPHTPAPENAPRDGVPKGKIVAFHLPLAGSNFFPPSAGGRGGGRGAPGGAAAPVAAAATADSAPLSIAELHSGKGKGNNAVERDIYVYIPAGYVPGTPMPLLFCHDSMGMHDTDPAPFLPDILDNMIADKRLPAMIAVMVDPSNQRSYEYDTVSGKYAEYVEAEILPEVSKRYNVAFSKDPEARAVMGGSSGGAAAMSMAWFHTELWHRVLLFSPTFITFQTDPVIAPRGAVEFYANFIPNSPAKPLRIWFEVGQNDQGGWPAASMRTAEVLKAKGYHYQFAYSKEAGHVDRPTRAQTLAPALEWLWKDYKPAAK